MPPWAWFIVACGCGGMFFVAAILVEPMQGTSGNVIPPRGWLSAVREVAREQGALLVVDEMITGWGRTGARR